MTCVTPQKHLEISKNHTSTRSKKQRESDGAPHHQFLPSLLVRDKNDKNNAKKKIGLQSRYGQEPLKNQIICPENGTAVLKGSKPTVKVKRNDDTMTQTHQQRAKQQKEAEGLYEAPDHQLLFFLFFCVMIKESKIMPKLLTYFQLLIFKETIT